MSLYMSLYGWWKGRADLVNPYVVLAAFALGGRVLRSGRLERAVNYGVVLGARVGGGDVALLDESGENSG